MAGIYTGVYLGTVALVYKCVHFIVFRVGNSFENGILIIIILTIFIMVGLSAGEKN